MTEPRPASAQPVNYAPRSPGVRLKLLRGVMRRLLLLHFRPGYVRRSLARRTGSCSRCGVCCHLVANQCRALRLDAAGHTLCTLYAFYRPPNCRTFPIDPRDLADRDLVAPDLPCGYAWPQEEKAATAAPPTPQAG